MADFEQTIPKEFFTDHKYCLQYLEQKIFPMCDKVDGVVWLAVPEDTRKDFLKIIRTYKRLGLVRNDIENILKVVQEER